MDEYVTRFSMLTTEEFGKLIRACMGYHATGEVQIWKAKWPRLSIISGQISTRRKISVKSGVYCAGSIEWKEGING